MKLSENGRGWIRSAAVAGQFYPKDASALRGLLGSLLARVKPGPAPKAVIAPHAGYAFSGAIAASALGQFASARNIIKRVVLVGPSHYLQFRGVAASGADLFATPLGLVPVDVDVVRQICALPQANVLDEAHVREHSLEVHLPFLQCVLGDFKIVPLLTGEIADDDLARIMAAVWNGAETRFVISSDLSHFHDYATAQKMDFATSRCVEQLQPERIGEEHACGRTAVCGLLNAARQHGLHARTVDLRNSGDTGGPRTGVVGYGAFVFVGNGRGN